MGSCVAKMLAKLLSRRLGTFAEEERPREDLGPRGGVLTRY